jgi:chromosome segregation ATPase
LEEKKKRIMELKKKIQELEKFKFVLNYKIKELKREIGPSSIQILKLNEQVSKMKSELKHFDRVNKNLVLIVEDMRMRQEGLKKELSVMTKRL